MIRALRRFRWCLVLAAAWPVVTSAVDVRVDVAPAQIVRRTFDPAHPPAEMPKLTPPEVGTCVFKFDCAMETEANGTRSGGSRVTEAVIHAGLSVTIWTPVDGPERVVTHEEGHRRICEIYYRPARDIGERIAWAAWNTPLPGGDRPALEKELDALQKKSISAFLRETATRCEYAQERFDAITDHSINPVPENVALAQAILQERSHYAATRGATATGATARSAPTRPSPATSAE